MKLNESTTAEFGLRKIRSVLGIRIPKEISRYCYSIKTPGIRPNPVLLMQGNHEFPDRKYHARLFIDKLGIRPQR